MPTVSHAKSNTVADWSGVATVGNSTGGSTTIQGSDLVRPSDWNSAHVFVPDPLGFYEPFILPNTNTTLSAPGIGTWYLDGPYNIPNGLTSGQLNVLVSNANGFLQGANFSAASTGSVSRFQTFFNQLALYRRGTSDSSSRLETVWTGQVSILASQELRLTTANTSSGTISNALTLSFPAQWNATGGLTYSTTAQSSSAAFGTSTAASTRADGYISTAAAFVTGARMDVIGFSTTIPAGEYWFGHMFTSTSSTTGTPGGVGTAGTLFQAHSRLGVIDAALGAYRLLGKSVSNATTNVPAFHGFLATTTSQASSIINTVDIRATTGRAYFNFFQSTY